MLSNTKKSRDRDYREEERDGKGGEMRSGTEGGE